MAFVLLTAFDFKATVDCAALFLPVDFNLFGSIAYTELSLVEALRCRFKFCLSCIIFSAFAASTSITVSDLVNEYLFILLFYGAVKSYFCSECSEEDDNVELRSALKSSGISLTLKVSSND